MLRCLSQSDSGHTDRGQQVFLFEESAGTVRQVAQLAGDRLLGGDTEPHPHHWRFESLAPNVLRATGDRGAPLQLRFDAARGVSVP